MNAIDNSFRQLLSFLLGIFSTYIALIFRAATVAEKVRGGDFSSRVSGSGFFVVALVIYAGTLNSAGIGVRNIANFGASVGGEGALTALLGSIVVTLAFIGFAIGVIDFADRR